jgi:hypothetical protein
VALARRDLARAGLLWGAVATIVGDLLGVQTRRWGEELREETRPEFVAAAARGRELELWDVAAMALSDGSNPR